MALQGLGGRGFEVGDRRSQNLDVLLQKSDATVAVPAEQATNLAGVVAVVDLVSGDIRAADAALSRLDNPETHVVRSGEPKSSAAVEFPRLTARSETSLSFLFGPSRHLLALVPRRPAEVGLTDLLPRLSAMRAARHPARLPLLGLGCLPDSFKNLGPSLFTPSVPGWLSFEERAITGPRAEALRSRLNDICATGFAMLRHGPILQDRRSLS